MSSFNRATFTQVCKGSGFSMRELAYIYGTTRQTIYDWQNDSRPTQLALADRERHASEALKKAIAERLLPFAPAMAKQTRNARIDIIVKSIMENMKPGRA